VLALAGGIYQLALSTLRWVMPFKVVGVICLALAAAGVFIGGRSLMRAAMRVGLRGLVIRLVVLYALAIVLTALLTPSLYQGSAHWLASAQTVHRALGQGVGAVGGAVLAAPDAIGFAATGRRTPLVVDGASQGAEAMPTPIVAQLVAAQGATANSGLTAPPAPAAQDLVATEQRALRVGDGARVVGTEGAALRARERPGTTAPIVTRFAADAVLRIIEGPQTADGRAWWKVVGTDGAGWCDATFLEPTSQT